MICLCLKRNWVKNKDVTYLCDKDKTVLYEIDNFDLKERVPMVVPAEPLNENRELLRAMSGKRNTKRGLT